MRFETGSRSVIHYLDDILFICSGDRCCFLLDSFRFLISKFGVSLLAEKTKGPANRLSFWGIEIDSLDMVFHLPEEKVLKLGSQIIGS